MNISPVSTQIILASASPRRRELLALLGLPFSVEVPEIEELRTPHETPESFALRLAKEKAAAIMAPANTLVLAADTIVIHGTQILGKPKDFVQATEFLRQLSASEHRVLTAVCLKKDQNQKSFSVSTRVLFRSLSDDEIKAYVDSGEPMDKAGAYAIQGGAAHMVKALFGSYTNVVGLPLCELRQVLLEEFG